MIDINNEFMDIFAMYCYDFHEQDKITLGWKIANLKNEMCAAVNEGLNTADIKEQRFNPNHPTFGAVFFKGKGIPTQAEVTNSITYYNEQQVDDQIMIIDGFRLYCHMKMRNGIPISCDNVFDWFPQFKKFYGMPNMIKKQRRSTEIIENEIINVYKSKKKNKKVG